MPKDTETQDEAVGSLADLGAAICDAIESLEAALNKNHDEQKRELRAIRDRLDGLGAPAEQPKKEEAEKPDLAELLKKVSENNSDAAKADSETSSKDDYRYHA